jgi:hypothetical protein
MVDKKVTDAMDRFIAECKKRNFHKETASALGIVAGSKEAHAVYGDSANSFNALTDMVIEYNDEQTVINKFMESVE